MRSSIFASRPLKSTMDHAPDARIMIYCEDGSIKFALTKSAAALHQRRKKTNEKNWIEDTRREATIRDARRSEHPGFPAATGSVDGYRQQESQSVSDAIAHPNHLKQEISGAQPRRGL
jgi:hypothetical protein